MNFRAETDLIAMRRALAEAERGRGLVEPNPMVGAVVVRDGQAVGVGHHARFGGPHAEVVALASGRRAARGATLYVTLEPCCHHGKTPPCTDADPRGRDRPRRGRDARPVPEGRRRRLRPARARRGSTVEVGPRGRGRAAAQRPVPQAAGDRAALRHGQVGDDARRQDRRPPRATAVDLRRRGRGPSSTSSGAGWTPSLVGIGTALADDPQLTARPPGPRTPLPDRARQRRPGCRSTAGSPDRPRGPRPGRRHRPRPGRSPRGAARRSAARSCAFAGDGRVPIVPLLDELGRRGMTNLLVEGGGRVLGAFLDAGQVDAVDVFIAPMIEGGVARLHARAGCRSRRRWPRPCGSTRHEVSVDRRRRPAPRGLLAADPGWRSRVALDLAGRYRDTVR